MCIWAMGRWAIENGDCEMGARKRDMVNGQWQMGFGTRLMQYMAKARGKGTWHSHMTRGHCQMEFGEMGTITPALANGR